MATKSPNDGFLDDYESIEVIGQGSFGKIRKVRRKKDGMVSLARDDSDTRSKTLIGLREEGIGF